MPDTDEPDTVPVSVNVFLLESLPLTVKAPVDEIEPVHVIATVPLSTLPLQLENVVLPGGRTAP